MSTQFPRFQKVGELIDWPVVKACTSSAHFPPTHIYVPPGKAYKHVCPACGEQTIIPGSTVTL